MKIVITKKLPYDLTGELADFRIDANNSDELLPVPRLRQMVADADGLICTLADNIDRTLMESSPKLKVIANYAVGHDNIDLDYAKYRGICVCTMQDVLTQSTAELGFGLILAASRRLIEADKFVRAGKFSGASPSSFLGQGLYKKTLGIFGMGKIGQAVAKIASGFSMEVIYHNRTPNHHAELLLNATYANMDEFLEWSDFIIITAPLNIETKHRFSMAEFRKMKKTAVLVNIGRGAIVRENDLAQALKENVIFAAGLDVYEYEPSVSENLKRLDNVVLLPHIGSATLSTRSQMVKICAESVLSVLVDGKIPKNAIV